MGLQVKLSKKREGKIIITHKSTGELIEISLIDCNTGMAQIGVEAKRSEFDIDREQLPVLEDGERVTTVLECLDKDYAEYQTRFCTPSTKQGMPESTIIIYGATSRFTMGRFYEVEGLITKEKNWYRLVPLNIKDVTGEVKGEFND